MRKIIVGVLVFIFMAVGLANANVFNETDGTVTIMASGGTVYSNYEQLANQVNGTEVVGSVTVPAGRYLVQAKAWVDQTVGVESFVQCNLVNLGINDRTRLNGSVLNYAVVVAAEVATFTEETVIEYSCVSDARVDVYNVVLTATTVSAIHQQ